MLVSFKDWKLVNWKRSRNEWRLDQIVYVRRVFHTIMFIYHCLSSLQCLKNQLISPHAYRTRLGFIVQEPYNSLQLYHWSTRAKLGNFEDNLGLINPRYIDA